MLEKDLSRDFTEIFKDDYPIWTPNNRNAGWPDRAIQLPDSKLVWFELKIVQERAGNHFIRIANLSPHQAAWLAKWQKNGGFCYLFIGMISYDNRISRYGIMGVGKWDIWLKVPKQPVNTDQFHVYTNNKENILQWFKKEMK